MTIARGLRLLSSVTVCAMLVTSAGHEQRGERLSRECRRAVVPLCGMTRDRAAIGGCLMERKDRLSGECQDEIRKRVAAAGDRGRGKAPGSAEHRYGTNPKQALDFYPAKGTKNAPLVIFVHGGGWSIGDKAQGTGTKAQFYTGMGYAFASLNYRLVPEVGPGDQATDIASAITHLRKNAVKLGFDPDSIFIMGHSAGAHLAALVSSDTRYLAKAAVPISAIKGTILLDGAGYDVAAQMTSKGNKVQGMYDAAFGKDPATQAALSPINHVSTPNSPKWLILHVDSRADSKKQSEALGQALSAKGAAVSVKSVPNSSHMSVNKDAGEGGTFVGNAIMAFLQR